ncbi:hypothetical protein FHG66_04625 [Rubellimicrobium rubrum]|uniref:Uncharacterized protein n=1 Tax=Rubellimicrobium rubrum TaxID=2585369 RepID=A0A5C4N3R1_9RHOB|nr:hypothetical protein [Rubellimicrobium rubrum]TNC52077.1 hypothetical protein FHG66_04625 [Rubellimicrobium rubrum]
MKLDIPCVHAKRKRLASGQIRTYYDHRATGKRLPDDPESHVIRRKLNEKPIGVAPAARTFRNLKTEHIVSTDFIALRDSTRSEYEWHIASLEPVLGPFPVFAIQPIHAETLMQKFAQRPALAKATRRTLLPCSAMRRISCDEFP